MGSGLTYAENKSRAHVQRAGVLRTGHQSGLQGTYERTIITSRPTMIDFSRWPTNNDQIINIIFFCPVSAGLLQLLFGRQHSRVGLAQSDVGETIPRAHGRSVVHRHLFGRFETVDRRPGQHRPLLGPERGPTATATRFLVTGTSLPHHDIRSSLHPFFIRIRAHVHRVRLTCDSSYYNTRRFFLFRTDILAGLLSDRRMVGSRHGELQRRSVARPQTGQIPTASARVVRAFVALCDVW